MVRKRVITLGLVLGLAVNQIILYQTKTVAADEYNIPQFLMNDIQQNLGTNQTDVNANSVQPNQQQVVIQQNHPQQVQEIPYSEQININKNVYQNPAQTRNNDYTQYQQVNNYDPNRPEWSEFCPYGLENARTKDDSFHMWGTNARYSADFQNYWVDRKKDFDNHLAQCDSVQDTNSRYGCYAKLRERQHRITANYVDPWQQAEIRRQRWAQAGQAWMMYDAMKNQNVNVNHSGTVNRYINFHSW